MAGLVKELRDLAELKRDGFLNEDGARANSSCLCLPAPTVTGGGRGSSRCVLPRELRI